MNWFNNLKIRTKLTSTFGVILILTAIVGFFSNVQMSKVYEHADEIADNNLPSIVGLFDLDDHLTQITRHWFEHILSTSNEDMAEAEKDLDVLIKDFKDHHKVFQKLVTTDEEKKLFAEFTAAADKCFDVHTKIIGLSKSGKKTEAFDIYRNEGKKNCELAAVIVDKLTKINKKEASEQIKIAETVFHSSRITNYIILGIAILAGMILATVSALSITRPIARAVVAADKIGQGDLTVQISSDCQDETGILLRSMGHMVANLKAMTTQLIDISSTIASASMQLRSTSEQIATGAEEVAMQTNSVATASGEMTSTSESIAHNCISAAETSRQTAAHAASGSTIVNDAISGMKVIADRVRQTSKTVEALGSRSDQIGDIIKTIEDIADQTNLLALNAAIEAARAGEQGRGFAVVADEVRALAERTTRATHEIGKMIKAIQHDTGDAVAAMEEGVREVEKGAEASNKSGEALAEILLGINDVSEQISMIATAAQQQTATTSDVSSNITQITDVIQQTARGAEETSGAAAQLASQAEQLQAIVRKYRI